MTRPYQIAPSLLACDLGRMKDEIIAVEKAGADVLHLDIMDGHFVPNITFGFGVIEKLRGVTKLPFDAHLMIENADRFIDHFVSAGCNWISVHTEACPHVHRTLSHIRQLGAKAGIAINPGTSLRVLDPLLDQIDYVLLMSVNPGFGGQSFIENTFERLKALRTMLGTRKVPIEIDGGIKTNNIGDAAKAGADILVVGTGLFEAKDYNIRMKELRTVVEKALQ